MATSKWYDNLSKEEIEQRAQQAYLDQVTQSKSAGGVSSLNLGAGKYGLTETGSVYVDNAGQRGTVIDNVYTGKGLSVSGGRYEFNDEEAAYVQAFYNFENIRGGRDELQAGTAYYDALQSLAKKGESVLKGKGASLKYRELKRQQPATPAKTTAAPAKPAAPAAKAPVPSPRITAPIRTNVAQPQMPTLSLRPKATAKPVPARANLVPPQPINQPKRNVKTRPTISIRPLKSSWKYKGV